MTDKETIMPGKGIEIVRKDNRIALSGGGIEICRKGKSVSAEFNSTGLVYVLLDCSSSMEGSKFDQAKKGMLDFSREAKPKGFKIGLITFSSKVSHICEPTGDISLLENIIDVLYANGGTAMSEAILLAIEKFSGHKQTRVIVLVTDGMPNSQQDTIDAADIAKRNGIDIIAIGTDDADRAFLSRIASRKELGLKVENNNLRDGIKSTAGMLPMLTGETKK